VNDGTLKGLGRYYSRVVDVTPTQIDLMDTVVLSVGDGMDST
jgi:hypothetical protein